METKLLEAFVELNRRGTMRAVAAATGYATSAISAQLDTLERDLGVELTERAGRNVRLTTAGRQLLGYADQILATVEAARIALRGTEPSGLLRAAAYASALATDIIPIVQELATSHPGLRLELQEREPTEVIQLLADNQIDLGFVYDFSLVPRFRDDGVALRFLHAEPLVLAVPASRIGSGLVESIEAVASSAGLPWVVNSRGDDDSELVERVCATAGVTPVIAHKVDSLLLILEFAAADLGIALVPSLVTARAGVHLLPIPGDGPVKRMYAATRPGRQDWPASALLTERVAAHTQRRVSLTADARRIRRPS